MLTNTAWAGIILIVLVAATVAVWRLYPRVLPVVLCHNAVWAGTITLIGTDLIRYGEAGTGAWLVLLSGILAFNVGAVVAALLRGTESASEAVAFATGPSVPALVSRTTFYVLAGLYAAGFATYLISTISRFGLETLLTNPQLIRAADGQSYLESVPFVGRMLLYFGPLVFVLLCFKQAVSRPFPLYVRVLGVVAVAVSMLALLQRTNLFVSVLWAAAVFITARVGLQRGERPQFDSMLARLRWHAKNGVVIPMLLGAVVLLVAFQIVGSALNKNGQQAISSGTVSPVLIDSGLASPFMYVTSGSMGFLNLVESENFSWPKEQETGLHIGDNNPQTWGAATFAPVVRLIPGVRQWDAIAPFIDVGDGMVTNVFTWLEPLYRDFRAIGVIVGMLGIGLLTSALFLRRFESPTVFYIQAALFSTIFLAGFVPKYNTNIFLGGILIVLALPLIARAPRVLRFRRHPGAEASETRETGASR